MLCNALTLLVGLLAPSLTLAGYTFTTYDVPGSVSTTVEGINNSGEAVGTYTTPTALGLPPSHGFVLSPTGTLTTYDVPNSTLTYAKGVSDSGEVLGITRAPPTRRPTTATSANPEAPSITSTSRTASRRKSTD
jgi:hypothetical protein